MFEFKDDEIFLMSIEEYEKYKNDILQIKAWWWLRSSGFKSDYVAHVYSNGSVSYIGNYINHDYDAVRPALYLDFTDFNKSEKFVYCGITWIVLDEHLAIAEMPISFHKFDENNNIYETSEIRQFLLNWYNERKFFNNPLYE